MDGKKLAQYVQAVMDEKGLSAKLILKGAVGRW